MGKVNEYEVKRMLQLASLIRELERPPVKVLDWLMWFWERDFDAIRIYLLRELGYGEATGLVLMNVFYSVMELVDEHSPTTAWPKIAIGIGREFSRVMYFNMQLPMQNAESVQVMKDEFLLMVSEFGISEFTYQEDSLSILGSIGDLPARLLWKAKIRMWWD